MLNLVAHALHRPHVTRMTKRVGRRLRPIRPSRQAELWYLNRLTDVIKEMRARAKVILKEYLPATRGMDADPWDRALRELAKDTTFNSLKGQAKFLANLATRKSQQWTDAKLAKEVHRAVGVDVRAALHTQGKIAGKMREFVKWNTDLISTLPDRFKEDLGDKLAASWAAGERAETMGGFIDDIIEKVGDTCEANAALIARDQTAKMNAAFTQVRHEELGIRRYEWSTSSDERVREDHAALNNQVFRWDEPGPLAGTIDGEPCHPGEDIQCRCVAIPVFDLDEGERQ